MRMKAESHLREYAVVLLHNSKGHIARNEAVSKTVLISLLLLPQTSPFIEYFCLSRTLYFLICLQKQTPKASLLFDSQILHIAIQIIHGTCERIILLSIAIIIITIDNM